MSQKSARSNVALRLPASLKAEAEKLAAEDGTTLNTLISIAVAEKIAALRTVDYLVERARRGDVDLAKSIIARAGKPGRVRKGDEV